MYGRVKLNVGGTHFETTRATLTSCPESLLAKMFDPNSKLPPAGVTEDGAFFLDACPRAFAVILDWLRYIEILDKEVHPDDVIPVADYFGLPELCEKLKALNINDVDIIRLNVGGTIFETTRGTMRQKPDSFLAKMFTPGSDIHPLNFLPVTADGSYFIDASPCAFELVLNWLRIGHEEESGINSTILPKDFPWDDLAHAAKIIGLVDMFVDKFDETAELIRFKFL